MNFSCKVRITRDKPALNSTDETVSITDDGGKGLLKIGTKLVLNCSHLKPLNIPRMLSAKSIYLDIEPAYVKQYNITQITFIFANTNDLKVATDSLSQYMIAKQPKRIMSAINRNYDPIPPESPSQSKNSLVNSGTLSSNNKIIGDNRATAPKYTSRPSGDTQATTPKRAAAILADEFNEQYESNNHTEIVRKPTRTISNVSLTPKRTGPININKTGTDSSRKRTLSENNTDVLVFDDVSNNDDSPKRNKTQLLSDEDVQYNPASPQRSYSSSPVRSYPPYSYRCMANLGNSCYMNASLQALASIPHFVSQLLNAVPEYSAAEEDKPRRSALLKSISDVYRHIFSPKDTIKRGDSEYSRQGEAGPVPRSKLAAVREAAGKQIDKTMSDTIQHDAQEFLGCLIDIIYDEIEGRIKVNNLSPKSEKEIKSPINRSFSSLNVSSKNDPEFLIPNLRHYKRKHRKRVSQSNPGKLFEFKCNSRLICNSCGTKVINKETGREIQIALTGENTSVEAFLISHFARTNLTWKCSDCSETDASMSSSFDELPEYLIVVLKRYEFNSLGGAKDSRKINIERDLHLQMLCEGSDLKNEELKPQKSNSIYDCDEKISSKSHDKNSLSSELPKNNIGSPGNEQDMDTVQESNNDPNNEADSQRDLFDDKDDQDVALIVDVDPNGNMSQQRNEIISINKIGSNELSDFQQTGGAMIEAETTEDMSIQGVEAEIIGEKKDTYVKWHVLTAEKMFEYQKFILDGLPLSQFKSLKEWRNDFCDTRIGEIPLQVNDRKLHEFEMNGDGNCLFRCFSWWLFGGDESHHDILRKWICDFIEMFPKDFESLASQSWFSEFEEYIKVMRDDGSWGTQLEIWAMATALQCTIYSHLDGQWSKFLPRFRLKRSNNNSVEKIVGDVVDTTFTHGAIYIRNLHQTHFNVVSKVRTFNEITQMHETRSEDATNEMGGFVQVEKVISRKDGNKTITANDSDDDYVYVPKPTYCYKDGDGPVYTLTAVVNHYGHSLNHGHYTAFSFDVERYIWLRCDDNVVSKVTEEEVLKESRKTGYILVYRRRHPNDENQFREAL